MESIEEKSKEFLGVMLLVPSELKNFFVTTLNLQMYGIPLAGNVQLKL